MIKVLVVDDSFLMRRLISDMLNSDSEIKVIGVAKDGVEALSRIKDMKPDVITLDIEMPGIPGLDVLHEVMRTMPTPVIMVSAYTKPGATETIHAFEYGAVDFLTKPSGPISVDMEKIKEDLIRLVKVAASIEVRKLVIARPKKIVRAPEQSEKVLVIGASSGGPPAIQAILSSLPEDFPVPILIVQHMPAGFTGSFAERLNEVSNIEVREAKRGDRLKPGLALLAPGNKHMVLKKRGKGMVVSLNKNPPVNNIRPSIDVTMKSVAELCDGNAIGVILTGMGRDGARGMAKIKKEGGQTISQDEGTSLIYGMPKAAVDEGAADHVLPLQEIGKKVVALL